MSGLPISPSIRQFDPSEGSEAASGAGPLARRPRSRVSFAEGYTSSRPSSSASSKVSTASYASAQEAIDEITDDWSDRRVLDGVEHTAHAVRDTVALFPHDRNLAETLSEFAEARHAVSAAQQALDAVTKATRSSGGREPAAVAMQRDALKEIGRNALVLGARHFGVIFTSLFSAHVMAKGFERYVGADSPQVQDAVTRVLNGASLALTLGGLAWPRASSSSAQTPNAAVDGGRSIMAAGTALSFVGAYLSATEDMATRGATRLAVFTPVRDFLLNVVGYSTNRDEANPDRFTPLLGPGVAYGAMQLLAGFATASPHIFSGASTAAESATWTQALTAFTKLSAVYAAPEAINLVLTEVINARSDKIAPGESKGVSDEEIKRKLQEPQTRSFVETQAASRVDITLNRPTLTSLGNQFFGPAANNTAYFLMAINLTGLIGQAAEKATNNPERQLALESLADAVLYTAFYLPFAAATNQNPSDTFRYRPSHPLAQTVVKRPAGEGAETSAAPALRAGIPLADRTLRTAPAFLTAANRRLEAGEAAPLPRSRGQVPPPPGNTPASSVLSYDVTDASWRPPTQEEVMADYRHGVREDAYLAEAEGAIIARRLGLNIPVYQDSFPEEEFEQRDMGGGSHCLIHAEVGAATYLSSGTPRGASEEEIHDLRDHAAENLDQGTLEAYAAVVLAASGQEGQGEPGLGAALEARAPQGAAAPPSANPMRQPIATFGDPERALQDRVALLHNSRSNHYTLLIRKDQD
jgi:hypothetical protein